MPDHMRQVTEALKAQPFSSVNTPFTSSHRQQSHESPLERVPSDTSSLSTGIVDPNRMIKPHQRRGNLPPLPDLRFEQSYLASISAADTWGRIAWITIRDQVLLPLMQGTLWTLALCGWKYWHRGASTTGRTLGFTIRRWWWQLNNWDVSRL